MFFFWWYLLIILSVIFIFSESGFYRFRFTAWVKHTTTIIHLLYLCAVVILTFIFLESFSLIRFCVTYRFRIDNTDHIIDVNKGNIPFEYDQVNIICPTYTPGTHEDDAEKYIIYNVSNFMYFKLDTLFKTHYNVTARFDRAKVYLWVH